MEQSIEKLEKQFLEELNLCTSEDTVFTLEKKFLGKDGVLKAILAGIKDLSVEEKKTIGVKANILKNTIEEKSEEKKVYLRNLALKEQEEQEDLDVSLQFPLKERGHMHPISLTSKILEEIFISLGFKIEDGPQIETEEYNFDKLNIPDNHPARDVWDTFWLHDDINKDRKSGDKYLLRTHTSPVQIRTMLKEKLPIKIIVP